MMAPRFAATWRSPILDDIPLSQQLNRSRHQPESWTELTN